MKAPNKIYLTRLSYGAILGTYSEEPIHPKEGEGIEYIRKDALLEWAKETYLTENASAIRKVCFKQLIDKIESM